MGSRTMELQIYTSSFARRQDEDLRMLPTRVKEPLEHQNFMLRNKHARETITVVFPALAAARRLKHVNEVLHLCCLPTSVYSRPENSLDPNRMHV